MTPLPTQPPEVQTAALRSLAVLQFGRPRADADHQRAAMCAANESGQPLPPLARAA